MEQVILWARFWCSAIADTRDTGFFWDERCFWHSGGNYAFTQPVGGLVQPLASGGLPEDPETKRRLKNLMDVTGLTDELTVSSAPEATLDMLQRVHPAAYLTEFKKLSDAGGGELGLRTPFGKGGFEIAALSAGLVVEAARHVGQGKIRNAYALARPPGHHCLPDFPNGFCLLANIAIAAEELLATGLAQRIAIIDWDVHHGNGSEAIFYNRRNVLTLSVHQERNYPMDTGALEDRGEGDGEGANINTPLPPGAGHATYIDVMDRLILPALTRFQPDFIFVACGYDAAVIDPLSRMMATAETFAVMTEKVARFADQTCGGKLVLAHEGGYSEVYVPFCGHATLAALSGSSTEAPDPFAKTFQLRQPGGDMQAFLDDYVTGIVDKFGLS
ncbi:MAG: class II histone deacetylase [Pseudomonadota bacterium]